MKQKFKNLSMQKKMMLVFAVPVSILSLLILCVAYPVLNGKYRERLLYSMNQSCVQAAAFLESYVENMKYLSDLMGTDAELQRILTKEGFAEKKTIPEEYREFDRLRVRLTDIELSNPMFRIGIYVPDEVFYSSNHQFVYPESELTSLSEYEQMRQAFDRGGIWFSTGTEKNPANIRESYETLVLYSVIHSAYGDGKALCISKVSTDLEDLKEVLKNANVTEQGFSCLVNEKNEILFSSERTQAQRRKVNEAWIRKKEIRKNQQVEVKGQKYFISSQELKGMEWKLLTLTPLEEIEQQGQMVGIIFVAVGVGTVLTVLVSSWLLSRYYVMRLIRVRSRMKSLQEGDMNTGFSLEERVESEDEISEIYYSFNDMVERLRKLLQEHYRMGKSVKAAELKALQAQINPHFLYNTLDLVNWMAMDYGASEIADIAYNLAKFYRLSLNHGKNILTIAEELEHVRAYVEIENFHFEQAIRLEICVPEQLQTLACPNIILQPFVENAIVHGIAEFPEITECNIRICAEQKDKDIEFLVWDDGRGIPEDQLEEIVSVDLQNNTKGYGVKNINFRLKLYYGETYGVIYENTCKEGTKVRIRIPALTKEETKIRLNGLM